MTLDRVSSRSMPLLYLSRGGCCVIVCTLVPVKLENLSAFVIVKQAKHVSRVPQEDEDNIIRERCHTACLHHNDLNRIRTEGGAALSVFVLMYQ